MPATAALADLKTLVSRRFGTVGAVDFGAADFGAVDFTSTEGRAGLTVSGLDALLGAAGIPRGRLTEIFGSRSSGKTSLAFAALAACTRSGEFGAYVDLQGSYFAPAAAAAGIDVQRLIVARPRRLAAARAAVDALVRGSACAVVAFDCSDAPGVLQAHHCARLVAQAEKTGTALLVISSGGMPAVASFASLRLHASGLSPLWQEGSDGGARLLGCVARFEIAKARMLVPRQSAQFEALLPDVAGTWPTAPT